jgi:hypothetical protein
MRTKIMGSVGKNAGRRLRRPELHGEYKQQVKKTSSIHVTTTNETRELGEGGNDLQREGWITEATGGDHNKQSAQNFR